MDFELDVPDECRPESMESPSAGYCGQPLELWGSQLSMLMCFAEQGLVGWLFGQWREQRRMDCIGLRGSDGVLGEVGKEGRG